MAKLTIECSTWGNIRGYKVDEQRKEVDTHSVLIDKIIYPGDKIEIDLREGNYRLIINTNDVFNERNNYAEQFRINY